MVSGGFAAVLLAGGRGSRLGGVHKPALVVDGRSLLDRALAAVPDAEPVVVVGPQTAVSRTVHVHWTREQPPGGGPVAGLAAGLAELADATEVAVLATDLPGVTADTIRRLRAARVTDGAILADSHRQWLIGVWRVDALRGALPAEVSGASLRSVLGGLDFVVVPALAGESFDVDTPADLERVASQPSH